MKTGKKLFTIGIVTCGRRNKLLRLLRALQNQCDFTIDVFINENGSHELSTNDFSALSRLRIIVFRQQEANIPKARNTLLRAAKRWAEWMVFIDDDCFPPDGWVETITQFLLSKKVRTAYMVQGVTQIDPNVDIYTGISQSLYLAWFWHNTKGSHSMILDTKCCALRLFHQASGGLMFDESLRYGSDIDLGCRVRIRFGDKNIALLRSWTVQHEERSGMIAFIVHRARLSFAFRSIVKRYPKMLRSAPLSEKIRTIGKLLLKKCKVFH